MTQFALDTILAKFPDGLRGKRLGVLCHAASVSSRLTHIVDELAGRSDCTLAAVFGPQHGLYGQTQDNMIEWEGGFAHPRYGVPVYSLYGTTRKPSQRMLAGLDAFVVDLQDVGARPYTYVWTVKLCLEACAEAGIAVWVLDRPNPMSAVAFDGPMIDPEYFSFVGGAVIPLCHRMTMGEMTRLVQDRYVPGVELHVVGMDGWWRDSLWPDTGLPWVLPSPNMPTVDAAVVYPGMVLLEATNVSEGRGTVRPFEMFGAPYLDQFGFAAQVPREAMRGAMLREHSFIPTFNKWKGQSCAGWQMHVTDARTFCPVSAATGILQAAFRLSNGAFEWKAPPYEYEMVKLPIDILAGSGDLRDAIEHGRSITELREQWRQGWRLFEPVFRHYAMYPERRP